METKQVTTSYQPKYHIRIVTAASLFDGHDAAINIMRRIMQRSGAEIIHLGHNRSAKEIVDTAIQEDVQGIALTSYQGGHNEYFRYIYDMLHEKGAGHIKIFGGGGGTILPDEIKALQEYGITRIYSPDDGRHMGLQGMINDVLQKCDFPLGENLNGELKKLSSKDHLAISRMITAVENFPEQNQHWIADISAKAKQSHVPVLGITGTGGAGKSSMIDEIIRRYLLDFPDKDLAVISVDPSKRKTGGALLGDRIRMNALASDRVYMRSLATRQSNLALSKYIQQAIDILKAASFDLIILETSGIGQSDTEIVDHADMSLYIMTPEFGAASQLEKIDMLDFADVIAINKFDKRGAQDALRDVRKQYKRNHELWDVAEEKIPVFGTIASQFNDPGTNALYKKVIEVLETKAHAAFHSTFPFQTGESEKIYIIPPQRIRYLSEIADNNRKYDQWANEEAKKAGLIYSLQLAQKHFDEKQEADLGQQLKNEFEKLRQDVDGEVWRWIEEWPEIRRTYVDDDFTYKVRGRDIKVDTHTRSLSGTKIPVVALPTAEDWGTLVHWVTQENLPGRFPFTAGIYPFKRKGEDPTRMFAGEGAPERTNKRFHYVSRGLPASRLSTAFDSVTLYGEDPDYRPDIYGKIGNSGVSICSLDDAKRLYSGFDLCDPKTSVSMTINGPAATICAFFMNAAIDQQCEIYIKENKLESKVESALKKKYDDQSWPRPQYDSAIPEGHNGLGLMLIGITGDEVLEPEIYNQLKSKALNSVRGTVQADILKEDQAQNTCIFSTEFSLRLMGDMQEYFINENIRNFYSVSISGYHIAEAGANPITQLAFTLANGFTFVEYYLSRGLDIDDFAPNLSFFFSNGVDPEYAVIGRVARRIWSKAMKYKYGGNDRSQKLKYHIQTSGRSLHAQEISFNDIRTTLQALYAIYDNCNSLHTNAYDEAITTPTEESVRRAMAIQLIINHELGLAKNENPLQGAFIIEELTDLVEAAVLMEFDRITERGGVLGAMETMYQRSKIQEESLYYETLKHSGEYPIIGVNTFLSDDGSPTVLPREVIRATTEEKEMQIKRLHDLHKANKPASVDSLKKLQEVSINNENTFASLMEAAKNCSLGQITHALYQVGGQYRRNM
ncbi:MAG TPA: methylmalonyl-CoA mutase family protein [Saprospiraceae bacterium]|nr:methylmalonyl-CoA mutase family protein [Saprospiraceae bacterium]